MLAQPSPDDRGRAREASDRRDWSTALPLYEQLVRNRPHDVELLIESARVHGFADRNAAAARLYRQALAAAPERRDDIVPSLAWQALWSAQAAEAQALFMESLPRLADARRAEWLDGLGQARQALGDQAGALAAFREADAMAPGQRRLQQRLAMSWLWNGHEARAVEQLQDLVQRYPADRELAWSLANVHNFAGAHRAALTGFGAWPPPRAAGERADLARAWRWAGFEERALPLLHEPVDAESAWLREYRVRREVSPYGYTSVERSDDRDRLTLGASMVGAGWHPWPGATLELQGRSLRLRDPQGEASGRQLSTLLRWRVGAPTTAWGTWWPALAMRASTIGGWHALAPTLRLAGVPRDHWRLDLEATRELVETPRAVVHRVHADVWSAGFEHRPPSPWQASAGVAMLRFDDGTRRLRLGGRLSHRMATRPRSWAGVEGAWIERMHGDAAVDRGYWNPRRHHEVRAFMALDHESRPFDLQARLALGLSREVDGSGLVGRGRPHLWELGLGWDPGSGVRLRLAAGGSGAGLGIGGGGAGYWRRYVNLAANAWF